MEDQLLSVDSLQTFFFTMRGVVRAVDDVSLGMQRSEVLGLVGESGSGKSTLGLSILKLVPPPGRVVRGSIVFDELNLLKLGSEDMRKIRGRRISMVFQDPMTSLDPLMRVGEHLIEAVRVHLKVSKDEAREKAVDLFQTIGIPAERFNDYPHQFSGGMRQRIMIALAIALNPDLVIADEPTTALDVIVQARILDLLKNLRDAYRVAMMLITHDLSIVLERCDNVAVMYAGKIVEHASSVALHRHPLHPYTQGLLQSIPNVELADQKLSAIPGLPPDLVNPPHGCRFWPRCPHSMDVCRRKEPPLTITDGDHRVNCFLYGGADA